MNEVDRIRSSCRFVFSHFGGEVGLTGDGALVQEARNALLPVRPYVRNLGSDNEPIHEWEIILRPQLSPAQLMGENVPEYQREE